MATNVTAGKPKIGGAVYAAPAGSTLPTDATTALDAAFKSLGYCSEEGLVNSNSPSVTEIKAWGGDTVLTVQEERPDRFKVTLIEALNLEVLKVIYGSTNVTGALSTGVTVGVDASEPAEFCWAIDMILNGAVKRVVIPHGKITELEDITYSDTDAVGYGITITSLPDSSGKSHYEYIKTA